MNIIYLKFKSIKLYVAFKWTLPKADLRYATNIDWNYHHSLLLLSLFVFFLSVPLLCEQDGTRPFKSHFKWNIWSRLCRLISGSCHMYPSQSLLVKNNTVMNGCTFFPLTTRKYRNVEWRVCNAPWMHRINGARTPYSRQPNQNKNCVHFLGHLVVNRKTKLLISEPLSNCHAWTRGEQRAKRQFNFLRWNG